MKWVPLGLAVSVLVLGHSQEGVASTRFGRKVLPVKDRSAYSFVRLDDIDFPYLENDSAVVSCVVYRGTRRYYVEVSVTNKTTGSFQLTGDSIRYRKTGYTAYRTNALVAAREIADAANVPFEPTPPPNVGTTTTIDVTESGTGSGYSRVTGTATTGPSTEQAGANLGNALGNLLAARSAAKSQSENARFASFLGTFAIDLEPGPIAPGATQVVVATFEQVKDKKAPFDVAIAVRGSEFVFRFEEW